MRAPNTGVGLAPTTGRDVLSRGVIYGTQHAGDPGSRRRDRGGFLGGLLPSILAAYFVASMAGSQRICVDIMLAFRRSCLSLPFAAIFGAGTGSVSIVTVVVATIGRGLVAGSSDRRHGTGIHGGGRAVGVSGTRRLICYLTLNCISTIFVFSPCGQIKDRHSDRLSSFLGFGH